ncbi:helix-turn-helix domain-containing protein [Paenalcaligenes niemegkensis]|uniref:IclR family transcriptional regulator domain-containing protein n=1 Tax=Paenalcaligenes niemegkensis TaxID=2895469 RepID=UPI001EE9457F|nr:IclR family transcriptional regulator C-terminal domain-containing protein [Paenalcaligenes niemegkensis]MCQ9616160.1 helix-turn-helix domain-containing protein [Paenalcaligenes niemegkensis]
MANADTSPTSKKRNESELLLSFARGLAVIEVFSRTNAPQSMAEIAKMTKLPRATVRRILFTLKDLGYALEDDKKYCLTPKILTLAQAYLVSSCLPRTIQPILEDITKHTGESSSFAVLEDTNIIYVARSSEEKMRIMSGSLHVGSTLPAYCTSMGRAILSQLSKNEQLGILKASNIIRHTEYTLINLDDILETLDNDRINGYSIVNQELELGLCSISVAVKSRDNKVLGSLNISTHVLRTDPTQVREKYLPYLESALKMISL